jgi:hypothetical protein
MLSSLPSPSLASLSQQPLEGDMATDVDGAHAPLTSARGDPSTGSAN